MGRKSAMKERGKIKANLELALLVVSLPVVIFLASVYELLISGFTGLNRK